MPPHTTIIAKPPRPLPMAPPSPDATAASTPELDAAAAPSLPTDAIFEILSRTPIKSLCRFRCVCREWRALIAGPAFLAAHRSRAGTLPLLAAARYSGTKDLGLRLMDLDGKVVREMKIELSCYYYQTFRLNVLDGRFCLVGDRDYHTHMIDVAAGEVLFTTQKLNGTPSTFSYGRTGVHALVGAGHAALPGKLKLVRLMECFDPAGGGLKQVCQVLEYDPRAGGGEWCWWRESHSPPPEAGDPRPRSSTATVDGVVHFLTSLGNVLRFDLETQQWRKTVGGPAVEEGSSETRITELNGALCMFTQRRPRRRRAAEQPCIDIWRLADPDNSTWVKAYTVPTDRYLMPLMVTPDGGKLLFSGPPSTRSTPPQLLLYDLGDKTWSEAMRISDNNLVGFVLCSLQLQHFVGEL